MDNHKYTCVIIFTFLIKKGNGETMTKVSKKVVSLVLALTMIFSVFAVAASARRITPHSKPVATAIETVAIQKAVIRSGLAKKTAGDVIILADDALAAKGSLDRVTAKALILKNLKDSVLPVYGVTTRLLISAPLNAKDIAIDLAIINWHGTLTKLHTWAGITALVGFHWMHAIKDFACAFVLHAPKAALGKVLLGVDAVSTFNDAVIFGTSAAKLAKINAKLLADNALLASGTAKVLTGAASITYGTVKRLHGDLRIATSGLTAANAANFIDHVDAYTTWAKKAAAPVVLAAAPVVLGTPVVAAAVAAPVVIGAKVATAAALAAPVAAAALAAPVVAGAAALPVVAAAGFGAYKLLNKDDAAAPVADVTVAAPAAATAAPVEVVETAAAVVDNAVVAPTDAIA